MEPAPVSRVLRGLEEALLSKGTLLAVSFLMMACPERKQPLSRGRESLLRASKRGIIAIVHHVGDGVCVWQAVRVKNGFI